jgi:hypothetical protein
MRLGKVSKAGVQLLLDRPVEESRLPDLCLSPWYKMRQFLLGSPHNILTRAIEVERIESLTVLSAQFPYGFSFNGGAKVAPV